MWDVDERLRTINRQIDKWTPRRRSVSTTNARLTRVESSHTDFACSCFPSCAVALGFAAAPWHLLDRRADLDRWRVTWRRCHTPHRVRYQQTIRSGLPARHAGRGGRRSVCVICGTGYASGWNGSSGVRVIGMVEGQW